MPTNRDNDRPTARGEAGRVKTTPGDTPPAAEALAARAAAVLRKNDMGGWTRAAPTLYPHQWS